MRSLILAAVMLAAIPVAAPAAPGNKPKAQENSKEDDKPKIASRPTFRHDKPRP